MPPTLPRNARCSGTLLYDASARHEYLFFDMSWKKEG